MARALIAGRELEAMSMAREWQALFGDRHYLELQRLAALKMKPSSRAAWR